MAQARVPCSLQCRQSWPSVTPISAITIILENRQAGIAARSDFIDPSGVLNANGRAINTPEMKLIFQKVTLSITNGKLALLAQRGQQIADVLRNGGR